MVNGEWRKLIDGSQRGLGAALQRGGLRLLSLPYGWGVRVRNWLFDGGWKKTQRVAVPVVSIGNLSVGGTGKTPCVAYVARFFRQCDRRVAILSRGYGASAGRNDEALALEDELPDVPHLQGPDRVALAKAAVEELESEVLIIDDGFQHRSLARDLDVVLIDATAPWGYGGLLPRGMLREPPSSLWRAHVILLTRCDLVSPEEIGRIKGQIARWAPAVPIAESSHRPASWINAGNVVQPLAAMQHRVVAAFCGLGNPDAFRRTLQQLGHDPIAWRTFPDHHAYTRNDVEDLRTWARQQPGGTMIATTHKDLVKLRVEHLGEHDLWALRIQLELSAGKDVLENKLREVI